MEHEAERDAEVVRLDLPDQLLLSLERHQRKGRRLHERADPLQMDQRVGHVVEAPCTRLEERDDGLALELRRFPPCSVVERRPLIDRAFARQRHRLDLALLQLLDLALRPRLSLLGKELLVLGAVCLCRRLCGGASFDESFGPRGLGVLLRVVGELLKP